MKSRVVGIIKFESPRRDSRGGDLGPSFFAGEEGQSLQRWLAALVGEETPESGASRWENRRSIAPTPRRVRANIEQLAAELDREYSELAAT
ncbi:MAG: hypothetical protein IAF94_19640 [Pirellulaceae bacterium]|nr:hypothetical protein [Pirellulaceae bacterium]